MTAINQDPAGPYTNLIEEWRRRAAESGAGPVVALLYDLITCILMYCVSRAEQIRIDKLAEAAPAGGEDAAPLQQPELVTVGAAAPRAGRMPAVGLPAEPRLPRAFVRRAKNTSGPAPARAMRADDGPWPRWRVAMLVWTMAVGFLRFNSQKMGFGGGALACPYCSGLATMAV